MERAKALLQPTWRATAARVSSVSRGRSALSARGEDQALPTEEALRASGADWTVVRSAWFAQNFGDGPPAAELRRGELVFPAGEVAEPFVDVRDVAEVVVAAPAAGSGTSGGRRP